MNEFDDGGVGGQVRGISFCSVFPPQTCPVPPGTVPDFHLFPFIRDDENFLCLGEEHQTGNEKSVIEAMILFIVSLQNTYSLKHKQKQPKKTEQVDLLYC